MAERDDETVRIPSTDSDAEHDKIRSSNDRDQELERVGKRSQHNEGYDNAADGIRTPELTRIVDE